MAVALMAAASDAYAASTVVSDAVAYYFQDVAPPLKTMYVTAQTIEACVRKFADRCAIPGVTDKTAKRVIQYVRLVGGVELNQLSAPKIPRSFDRAKEEIRIQRTHFNQDVQLRERWLFARVEAVNRVCPDTKGEKRHSALDLGVDANFSRFWRQLPAEYAQTRSELDRDAASEEAKIRREWSPELCAKTLDVGRDVLSNLLLKVRPQVEDAALEVNETERWIRSYTSMWMIAVGLQSEIHPEVVEMVHAIEREPD
jgi:hypothetical protein